jgi:hypothetical protein
MDPNNRLTANNRCFSDRRIVEKRDEAGSSDSDFDDVVDTPNSLAHPRDVDCMSARFADRNAVKEGSRGAIRGKSPKPARF